MVRHPKSICLLLMTDGRTDFVSHTLTIKDGHVASLAKFRPAV